MTDHRSENDVVTVVVGRFEVLVGRGLADVLHEDRRIDVRAADLDSAALERSVAEMTPQVVILDEPANGSVLTRLRSIGPGSGMLVLAADPSRAYGMCCSPLGRLALHEASLLQIFSQLCISWRVANMHFEMPMETMIDTPARC